MKRKKSSFGFAEAVAVVLSFILSFGIILGASVPESYDYKEGDVVTEDIYAPREIEDSVTTTRRREAAANQVADQYTIDYDLNERLLGDVQKVLAAISSSRELTIGTEGKITILKGDIGGILSEAEMRQVITMQKSEYTAFAKNIKEVFSQVMESGVSDVEAALFEMVEGLRKVGVKEENIAIAESILSKYIKINESFDEELTNAAKDKAMKQVEPTIYKKNQSIARRGEVITKEQISLLSELGLLKGSAGISKKYAVAILALVVAVYMLGAYFVRSKKKKIYENYSHLILLLLLPTLMLLMLLLFRNTSGIYVYLLPIPVGAILMATFLGMRMAMITNVFICFAGSIILFQGEEFIISMAIYSAVAALIFKKVSGFSGYAKATLYTALLGAGTAVMAMLLTGKATGEVVNYTLFGALNGIITSVITIGLTPIFENVFNIVTPLKLNDLGNPEKPLLKRLMFEAPGTYHHALMVGNLAEAACIKIGANNQLARVAAYYHDIGKLKRPGYFFENQIGDNPHDTLTPMASAEILRSHIEAGIEIAKQYRLPKDIQDIIKQHHGTTLAGVFYKKALDENPEAEEKDFKYPGPKPESKEAGIVMLADSCEAAVRSLDEKTDESIRAMVTKIVKSRMTDGQLDECDLSFKELGEIIDAFTSMLGSYFHKRIKYDNKETENESDNRENG